MMVDRRRQVVLHIGQTKAGSTSIQNYLEAQRDALFKAGVLFPKSGFSRNNPFDSSRTAGHRQLVIDLQSNAEEFEKEISPYPNHSVLLSAENIFFDFTDDVLKYIGDYFKDWDVHIVVVLRPQFDWLRSRYVENVMSGFLRQTITFDAFSRTTVDRGFLDYEDRLKRVKNLLKARNVRAICFQDSREALIPRFLRAAGLPLTAPGEAITIHANQREKPAFLIEAKRRLNFMTTQLKSVEALELEKKIREAAQAMVTAGEAPSTSFLGRLQVSQSQCATFWHGNKSLEQEGLLDGPLSIGNLDTLCEVCDSDVLAATENLFSLGMIKARKIVESALDTNRFFSSPLKLSERERDYFQDIFHENPISLHLSAPETAMLAASRSGRLVRLIINKGAHFYRDTIKFDKMSLPTPLIVTQGESSCPWIFPGSLMSSPFALVLGADASIEIAFSLINEFTPRRVAILGGNSNLISADFLSDYGKEVVDNCVFFQSPC